MDKPSFPDRLRHRRRAPIAPAQRDQQVVRVLVAAPIVGVGVLLAYVWRDVPIASLLVGLLTAAIVRVVVDQHNGLMATTAPRPDVHTPPVTGADLLGEVSTARISLPDHELALAGAVGVYRVGVHSLRALAESDAPTGVMPEVTA